MMKNIFLTLCIMVCLLFSSCEASSQVVISDDVVSELYYDSGTNYIIVYYNGVPYYRHWYNDRWVYWLVPRERLPYIRRWSAPPTPIYRHRPPMHHNPPTYNRHYHNGNKPSGWHYNQGRPPQRPFNSNPRGFNPQGGQFHQRGGGTPRGESYRGNRR